jgi:pyruvate/2-oxoglutarate dehydrogenase complex dihydrolipoamide dehydrogenase (E3) component
MRVLTGEQVFVNLGTHASILSVPGLEAARPLTIIEALELDYLPEHLIVLGGGYVGLEMGQAFRRSPLTTRYARVALTQKLRHIIDEGVGYGLALEGISAADVARAK